MPFQLSYRITAPTVAYIEIDETPAKTKNDKEFLGL